MANTIPPISGVEPRQLLKAGWKVIYSDNALEFDFAMLLDNCVLVTTLRESMSTRTKP